MSAMEYRRVGATGLRVSALSLGTWLTFAEQATEVNIHALLSSAREGGVNSFDTADIYGSGRAEQNLGDAIKRLGWDRASYVLWTKVFNGTRACVNMHRTLNRKYLMLAIDEALDRLSTSYVDILLCHRPDPHTPMLEIVWAMSDIVSAGKAHYWGTCGWSASDIQNACHVADNYRLRRPCVEQTEYNLINRHLVDRHYAPILRETGIGIAGHSPLASGLLTGKYVDGVPRDSRAAAQGLGWLCTVLRDPQYFEQCTRLRQIAARLRVTPAQIAIAWCLKNPCLTTVILGARTDEQILHNLNALNVTPLLTPELMLELQDCFNT